MIDRDKVKTEEKWDLSHIYESEEDFQAAKDELGQLVNDFVENYHGDIEDGGDLLDALRDLEEIQVLASSISSYAYLAVEVDAGDIENNKRYAKTASFLSSLMSKLSFFENQALALPEEELAKAGQDEKYRKVIEKLLKRKPYLLSDEVEESLGRLSRILEFPFQVYNDTKFRDISFPDVETSKGSFPMTYNSFEGHMEYENDTELRRKAFEVFSDTLRKYQFTTGSAYNAQVQKEKTMADLRGYEDVTEYLLMGQDVTKDLYKRQVDVIMEELAPHMRKYARMLGKIHDLDQVHYSDLKIEVDPSYSPEISFDKAKQYVLEGLAVLGDEYRDILEEAFDNSWIDYAENKGKRTGAFCSSPYGEHSYVLMSFSNKMNDAMTLAHELGHAGHFMLAKTEQNLSNYNASTYFVEAPSTTNELIVENYLLDKAGEDKRMRRWILSQMISKTYYHNFVTHFMEACFQRRVYDLVEKGESLDALTFNGLFKDCLEEFWGDSVVLDPGAELTWMRQPHYYMGLYPYTYSAGLTIGTQVAKKIRKEGKKAADNWTRVLKVGGSKSPLELAREAGVDISTDQPLKDTIAYIGSIIDEIYDLSVELGDIEE